MGATLRPFDGGSPIALDKPIILIGRNESCDIALEHNSKVSRKHCCIVQCGDKFLFRDLGSMNGIRVNTHRVVEMELREGDQIAVADIHFTFCREDSRKKNVAAAKQKSPEVSMTTTPPGGDESEKAPLHQVVDKGQLPESRQPSEVGAQSSADGDSHVGEFASV